MSIFERVDRILFELCGEAMLDASERHFIACRSWRGVPANAAFAICAHRQRRRRAVLTHA
jgi:hypothetical protein